MTNLLVDCRLICDGPAADAVSDLLSAVADEGTTVQVLLGADRPGADATLAARLDLGRLPPARVHRLHAPASGRDGSDFTCWRQRVAQVLAASIAVQLEARQVVVPCDDREAGEALWPAGIRPAGLDVVAVRWRGRWEAIPPPGSAPAATVPRSPELPLLAFVSPIPPDASGIADYAMELLPQLARHYRVELVTPGPVQLPQFSGWTVRSPDWFDRNAGRYDRIVYQVGNSHFHQHMFALNERHPGLVVLHDAFLSGVARHMEKSGFRPGNFSERLYLDHGYGAVAERWRQRGLLDPVLRYPCSLGIIAPALGVVVHSQEARAIVATHYGEAVASTLTVIPHLRAVTGQPGREEARGALGLKDGDFLLCSFGATSLTKHNHRLLEAWRASPLGRDPQARLVFVGGGGDRYAIELARNVSGINATVTGRCSAELYRTYLQAADLAVQLRCLSRGETSGAALDCMAAGIPLIVNRHGSMAEIPDTVVVTLDDEFSDRALAAVLERLRADPVERKRLAAAGLDHVRRLHDPVEAGDRYRDAIEAAHRLLRAQWSLPQRLAQALPPAVVPQMAQTAAICAELSLPRPSEKTRLFFDVTAIARNDLRTGIERTVRNLLLAMLDEPPEGYRVEPVRLQDGQLILARDYTCRLMGIRRFPFVDEPVAPLPGDIYLMVDLAHGDVVAHRDLYRALRLQGVKTAFMVHDLLPVRQPRYFPSSAEADHTAWLEIVTEADVLVGVTRHVAEDLAEWVRDNFRDRAPAIGFSHHGAGLELAARPSRLSFLDRLRLPRIGRRPAFLTVGTVEPRKGHDDLLAAFDRLWTAGRDIDLIVVGRSGFRDLDVIRRLRHHPESGHRLHWLRKASDRMLDHLYRHADCLVAPSRAEGFGLPLVEAGLHGLPVLARDIPVFREVAPPGTRFFPDTGIDALASSLEVWLDTPAPRTLATPVLTWAESARNLFGLVSGQAEGVPAEGIGRCGWVRR